MSCYGFYFGTIYLICKHTQLVQVHLTFKECPDDVDLTQNWQKKRHPIFHSRIRKIKSIFLFYISLCYSESFKEMICDMSHCSWSFIPIKLRHHSHIEFDTFWSKHLTKRNKYYFLYKRMVNFKLSNQYFWSIVKKFLQVYQS